MFANDDVIASNCVIEKLSVSFVNQRREGGTGCQNNSRPGRYETTHFRMGIYTYRIPFCCVSQMERKHHTPGCVGTCL